MITTKIDLKISVIIPTYNRGSAILNTLKALCAQTLSASEYEIIVVDDGSPDNTSQIVREFMARHSDFHWQLFRHDTNKRRAGGCNTGLLAAKSPLVIFTDDDIIPVSSWLKTHVNTHERYDETVSVLGHIQYPDEWCARSNFIRFLNSRYIGNRGKKQNYPHIVLPNHYAGGNTSTRRDLIIQAGLFDETIARCEDVALGFKLDKAGVKLMYNPEAIVVHYAEAANDIDKWLAIFAKNYSNSTADLAELYPEHYAANAHWFVDAPRWGKESFRHAAIKTLLRLLVRKSIGKLLLAFIKKTDGNPLLYLPWAYAYLMLSTAIEAVKERDAAATPSR